MPQPQINQNQTGAYFNNINKGSSNNQKQYVLG